MPSKSKSATKKTTPTTKAPASKSSNLGALVKNPSGRASTFGVILDATGAYKTYDSTDYVTKFKVIDSSWNADSKAEGAFKRYVHVFVYTESPSTAPRVTRIGDVLRLRNFDVRTYQNNEVKAVFVKGTSDWAIYDGRNNANMTAVSGSSKSESLSGADKDTVKALRTWSDAFFKKKSIKQMNWFGRDEEDSTMDAEKVLEIKDIDKTVKLLADSTFVVDDKLYHKLAFADEKARIYFAEYAGQTSGIDSGDVLKLRSVSTVTSADSRKIVFNNYSTMLLLNKGTKDHDTVTKGCKNVSFDKGALKTQQFEELHMDKMQKVQIGLNSYAFSSSNAPANTKNLRQNVMKGYPILDNFEHGENDFLYENNFGFKFFSKRGSSVQKKYAGNRYYTFKELIQIQDSINNSKGGSASSYQYEKFLVRGFVLATEYDHIFQTSKLYSPSANRVWDVAQYSEASKTANDLQTILHNVFYMKDNSIESEQKCFPVYLITFDQNPQYIFDLWKVVPDYMDVQKLLKMNDKRQGEFSTYMENLKAPQYFYDMVLQLMVNNQGKVYFRVCDTIFWFPNN